jgi:diguanylate cyclase (GGDEF)-like protein
MLGIEPRALSGTLRAPLNSWVANPTWHLRFAKELEDHFETETGAARQRWLFITGWVGVAAIMAFSLTDRTMIPDALGVSLAVRLYAFLPTALVLIFSMRLPLPPWLREMLDSLLSLSAHASLLAILIASHHRNASFHVFGFVYATLFALTIARLRFPFALGSSILITFAFWMALPHIASLPASSHAFNLGLAVSGMGLGLFANHAQEHTTRLGYLQNLQGRLEQMDLTEHNLVLTQLAGTDPLTGIANRRTFEETLLAHQRSGNHFALIMLDVDHFKAYNDTYGHQAGDICLQAITGTMRLSVRDSDLVARLGGEEFIVLLPDADRSAAIAIAQRILSKVMELMLPHERSSTSPYVTVSAGLSLSHDSPSGSDVQERADIALYRAKAEGRNCWRFDGA